MTKQCHARGYQMLVDTRAGSNNPHCLEIIGAVIHNGQHARIWPCNGGWWQQWRHMPNGEIRTPNGRCLDGKKLRRGEHVHTWTCHNGQNQKWKIDARGRIRSFNGLCAVPVPASSYGNRLELKNCPSLAANKRPWTAVTLFEDYHRKYGFAKEYLLPIHMYGEWACHAENHVWACNTAPSFRNGHLVYTIGFVNAHQFALVNRQKKSCITTNVHVRGGRNVGAGVCDYKRHNLWTAQPVAANGNIANGNRNPRHMKNGVFVFRNVQNGQCLTSKLGNLDNGARWSLKPCNIALHPTQRVKLRAVGAGNRSTWGHQLQGARIAIGRECVTVGNKKANLAPAHSFQCANFRYFRIRPRLEYGVRCFDNGNKRHADAPIFQWACHGQHNQQWSAWSSSGGTFNIRNRQSGMCVYRSGKDGKLYQANCNARDGRQRFKLIR